MTTAYVLDKVGEPSQTFIANEIREVARQGDRVVVVAVDAAAGASASVPTVVLRSLAAPRLRLAAHHLLWWVRSPRRYARFRRVVSELGDEMGPGGGQVPWKRLPAVASRLRRAGVDGMHAHFAWEGAAAAMALSALTGLPWMLTVHANDIFARRRNLAPKLAAADVLVTVCDYNVRYLREELGVTRPVEVVVCGVDVPLHRPRGRRPHGGPDSARFPEIGEPGAGPVVDVVAVGRLVSKKGFDTLVQAAALLRRRRPDLRVRIVGDGPLREELAARVRDCGVGRVVELAGPQPHEAALAAIEQARIFCLPARIARNGDRDSMPVVVKEAMARGVPVVASDVGAIPEMVDETVGRLVPADDPQALADALDELLSMPPNQRAALGEAGRRRVVERFTLAGEVARLREVHTATFRTTRHDRAAAALYRPGGHSVREEGA